MQEAGVVINQFGFPLYWHIPENRTGVELPDSRDLWNVLWENRENLLGFAHSHPGTGDLYPSVIDITTFSAIERGLGTRLQWWIINETNFATCRWQLSEEGCVKNNSEYAVENHGTAHPKWADSWVHELRKLSNMTLTKSSGGVYIA